MTLQELLEYINLELLQIKSAGVSEAQKYRDCCDLIVKAHKLIDSNLLNEESIKSFVTPFKKFVWDMSRNLPKNDDDIKIIGSIKGWQRERTSKVTEKFSAIQQINGITGKALKDGFSYFAVINFVLNEHQWKFYNDAKKEEKRIYPPLDFDLDTYMQVTEQLLLSDNVYEQLAGLTASLGRRPTELFSENFSLVEGETHSMFFSGQLKTKKDNPDSYKIPTLFDAVDLLEIAETVINHNEVKEKLDLINQLCQDDETKKHELIDDRFNHRLNKVVKEKFSFIPIPTRLKDTQTEVTCKILRCCYATIMVSRECDKNNHFACVEYWGQILGHTSSEATRNYSYFRTFDYANMFYNLEVPSFDINLNLDNRKKLHSLMSESGDDINDLMAKMIACYELNKVKTITFSDTPWQVLKGSNTPKSGNEKVARAVQAIIEHNECQAEQELRYCITARAIMDLTGSRHSVVKSYLDEYGDLIEAHNDKYELTPVHNRGKTPISEVVIIN
jgi:hypothetical protein